MWKKFFQMFLLPPLLLLVIFPFLSFVTATLRPSSVKGLGSLISNDSLLLEGCALHWSGTLKNLIEFSDGAFHRLLGQVFFLPHNSLLARLQSQEFHVTGTFSLDDWIRLEILLGSVGDDYKKWLELEREIESLVNNASGSATVDGSRLFPGQAQGFARSFTKAYKDIIKTKAYPLFIVRMVVNSAICIKANSVEELKGLLPVSATNHPLVPFNSDDFKERCEPEVFLSNHINDRESYILCFFAESEFLRFPPSLERHRLTINGTSFEDCAETGLLHFLSVISFDQREKKLNPSILSINSNPLNQELVNFLSICNDASLLQTRECHIRFASLIQGLQNVTYVKKDSGLELKSGFLHFNSVLSHLTGFDNVFNLISFLKGEKNVSIEEVKFYAEENTLNDDLPGILTLKFDENATFVFQFESNHVHSRLLTGEMKRSKKMMIKDVGFDKFGATGNIAIPNAPIWIGFLQRSSMDSTITLEFVKESYSLVSETDSTRYFKHLPRNYSFVSFLVQAEVYNPINCMSLVQKWVSLLAGEGGLKSHDRNSLSKYLDATLKGLSRLQQFELARNLVDSISDNASLQKFFLKHGEIGEGFKIGVFFFWNVPSELIYSAAEEHAFKDRVLGLLKKEHFYMEVYFNWIERLDRSRWDMENVNRSISLFSLDENEPFFLYYSIFPLEKSLPILLHYGVNILSGRTRNGNDLLKLSLLMHNIATVKSLLSLTNLNPIFNTFRSQYEKEGISSGFELRTRLLEEKNIFQETGIRIFCSGYRYNVRDGKFESQLLDGFFVTLRIRKDTESVKEMVKLLLDSGFDPENDATLSRPFNSRRECIESYPYLSEMFGEYDGSSDAVPVIQPKLKSSMMKEVQLEASVFNSLDF